jgi:hypothetical protein
VLVTIGQDFDYRQRFDDYTGSHVFNFILRGPTTRQACSACSKTRGPTRRAVRTVLTREAWETTNEAWMVLHDMLARPVRESNLGEVIAVVRRQMTLVRGAMDGTMLRNEIFNFARIGTFIERPTTPRAFSTSSTTSCCPRSRGSSRASTTRSGKPCCARSRRPRLPLAQRGRLDPRGIADSSSSTAASRAASFLLREAGEQHGGLARKYCGETRAHELLARPAPSARRRDRGHIVERGLHEFITEFIAGTIPDRPRHCRRLSLYRIGW